MSIKENIEAIRRRIATVRDPQSVKLIAAVKNVPAEKVLEALSAGITDIGENRVQEAAGRVIIFKERFPQLTAHMIGHLQRNKVRQALDSFDIIQSVDSPRLAAEINARAAKPVSVLIEVNTSGEASKFGIEFSRAIGLIRSASALDKINILGLMTIGPLTNDPEKSRTAFRKLRELRDEVAGLGLARVKMQYLSMGMTDDFEIALAEGSNLVRIGRGIFKGG